MGDGSLAAWLARGPEDLRKGVTWTVGSELETIWLAANDREAMRARLEEAEAALAMLRQRQEEEELREVDDGASSSIDDDWPSWSDSDEEEEEDEAPGGRRGGSPGGKREDEAPRAAPVKSLQEQKQEEFHRKCDDISFRLKRIHQEGERVLAATDKPLRKRWSQRPGKEPVVVVSASEAPSSGSSSSGPGETSNRGAGVQLPGPWASDTLAEPEGSLAASPPSLPTLSLSSAYVETVASGGGANNPLFEAEDSDDAGDDELPFLPCDHPEPNRCPEGNVCPTPLLWLSQAGCHRGTRSGMGGGHPSPGVDQDREQGAHGGDELASPGAAPSAEEETQVGPPNLFEECLWWELSESSCSGDSSDAPSASDALCCLCFPEAVIGRSKPREQHHCLRRDPDGQGAKLAFRPHPGLVACCEARGHLEEGPRDHVPCC